MKLAFLIFAHALMLVLASAQENTTSQGILHRRPEFIRRVAKLRRGDRYAAPDFFGQ